MTTQEDKLFLDILAAVDTSLSDEKNTDIMLEKFGRMYMQKVQDKEFKSNPQIMKIIQHIIPEDFL